jgi:lipopolysaccharide biosynthesis glycosyltransferase
MMRAGDATIVLACAANQSYALPLAVMLRSALDHLAPGYRLDVYAVDDGLDASDRLRVQASLDERVTMRWLQPRPLSGSTLPTWGRMPDTTYQKLTLGDWLPAECAKAIWLDCDVLVLDDLARLWEAGMAGRVLLAAQDVRVPMLSSSFGVAAHEELGLKTDAKYFNAGVLVLDLTRWRESLVKERSAAYLERYRGRVFFWDQEALNAVLAGQWGELDARWNWHPTLERIIDEPSVPAEPSVVHFSGNLKPWSHHGLGHYHELYLQYLDKTAWSGTRPRRSCLDRALARYEVSSVRRWLYPAEQWGMRLTRAVTWD